jgi:hypothetical protein
VPEAIERLPAGVRRRLKSFADALERIKLEDLPMYAVRPTEPTHGEALERAKAAAAASGLQGAIDEARNGLTSYLDRVYTDGAFRNSGETFQWGSLGTMEDRIRVATSLGDAITALVFGDTLDEADRAELLGAWANLVD